MNTNECHFDRCGLHFRSLNDLVHHMEQAHLPSIEQKKRAEIEQLRQLKKVETASAAAAVATAPPPNSTGTSGDAAQATGASDAVQATGTMAAPQAEGTAHVDGTAQNGANGKDERSPTESNAPSEGSGGGDGGGLTVSLKEREAQFFSSTVPLSMICKLKPFQPDYRPQPIPPPCTQIKFNIYRKRPMPDLDEPTPMDTSHPPTMAPPPEVAVKRQPAATRRQISETSSADEYAERERSVSSSDGGPDRDEKRYACNVEGCRKTYKNAQGLRAHMKQVHNASVTGSRLSPTEESILNRIVPGSNTTMAPPRQAPPPVQHPAPQHAPPPQPPAASQQIQRPQPTGSTNAGGASAQMQAPAQQKPEHGCPHCTKRYKTISNLTKHMQDQHPHLAGAKPMTAQVVMSSPMRTQSPVDGGGRMQQHTQVVMRNPPMMAAQAAPASPQQQPPSSPCGVVHHHLAATAPPLQQQQQVRAQQGQQMTQQQVMQQRQQQRTASPAFAAQRVQSPMPPHSQASYAQQQAIQTSQSQQPQYMQQMATSQHVQQQQYLAYSPQATVGSVLSAQVSQAQQQHHQQQQQPLTTTQHGQTSGAPSLQYQQQQRAVGATQQRQPPTTIRVASLSGQPYQGQQQQGGQQVLMVQGSGGQQYYQQTTHPSGLIVRNRSQAGQHPAQQQQQQVPASGAPMVTGQGQGQQIYRGPHPGIVRGGANVPMERRTDSPHQQQPYMEQQQYAGDQQQAQYHVVTSHGAQTGVPTAPSSGSGPTAIRPDGSGGSAPTVTRLVTAQGGQIYEMPVERYAKIQTPHSQAVYQQQQPGAPQRHRIINASETGTRVPAGRAWHQQEAGAPMQGQRVIPGGTMDGAKATRIAGAQVVRPGYGTTRVYTSATAGGQGPAVQHRTIRLPASTAAAAARQQQDPAPTLQPQPPTSQPLPSVATLTAGRGQQKQQQPPVDHQDHQYPAVLHHHQRGGGQQSSGGGGQR